MRNIYFAGHSSQWAHIRVWIERAKLSGHHVTFDWTRMVEQHGRGNQDKTPKHVLITAAIQDTKGVIDADLLVLFPTEGVYGAMAELGIALGTDTEVWIVGEAPRYSVFFSHPLCEQITDTELSHRLADHHKG